MSVTTLDARTTHPLAVALTAVVDQVVALVQRPAAAPDSAAGLDLLVAVCAQVGRLQVASSRLSTAVDDDGLWATEGARSFAHWLAAATGMSFVKARDVVRMGRALRDHLPATSVAALAGEVSVEQTVALATLAPTTDARCAALAAPARECGEGFLLEQARQDGAEGFRRLVRRWAAAADPEADERGYREACEREFVTLSPTLGGFHLAGFVTTERGAVVSSALDAVMTAPAPGDTRTTQQRRAQGLGDLSRLVLDHGLAGTGAAVRPHLSVVVDFDTLRGAVEATREGSRSDPGEVAGPGEGVGFAPAGPDAHEGADVGVHRGAEPSEGGSRPFRLAPVADVERFAVAEILGAGPIPPSVLARLACDSEISRVVFGPGSQVINAGRAERTFSGPRRKAVIARDGTCRYPGCTAPPTLGEIHHVAEWVEDHGDTDVNLGILLCWHHHDQVHTRHIEIRRSPTGGWLFLTRHGRPVGNAV